MKPDQWEDYYQQKYCAKPPGESASSSILSCPGHRRMSQGPIIPTEALAITKPKRRRVEDPQKSAYQYVSSWAESLDGLWQWQYWDFPLEQAFNSLVSREGTRCCVCTLLAPDDMYKPLDRNKLMKLYKKYQKQKVKRRVLADSSSVVCQSLRIAVKRELIHLPLRKDGTKIKISKSVITDQKNCNPLPDSSSSSPVSSLPVSIPHSTSSDNDDPLITVETDQQGVSDKQVLPDSTSTIPLCIPPTISTDIPSPDTTVIDDSKGSNGSFDDVSTTITAQDLLATPPRAHPSASPDHKRIRRSPRNLSLQPTQHVISLKLGSHDLDESGSEMITCTLCKICVHKSCYGVNSPTPDHWLCVRCTNNVLEAECCLCTLRGGALKPTTDNRWAHIVCVVTLPEVSFGNAVAREPVVIDKIPAARKKLKCHYCETAIEGMTRHKGLCIQCCRAHCCLPFHVTCAQYQGLSPPALDGLFGLLCHKHDPESRQNKTVKLLDGEFTRGESVIAKMSNNKYSSAVVESVEEELFYEVLFDQDCTVCYNLPPCDLLTKDAQKGSSVQVKWSDDKVYAAKLLGWHTSLAYQVKFNDGSNSSVSEEDIYSSIEKLPKKVKNKMVTL